MRLLLVADTYPPARISGAVQLHDLVTEMVAQGHRVTVLIPAAGLPTPAAIEQMDGATVLRVRAPQTKDVGLVRRAFAEMWLPFALLRGLRKSGLAATRWEGVVWYSPTIFLGLVAKRVKRASGCRGYLILRDLFPDWAADAGIMRRGLAYRLLKHVERYQYRQADVIGVQTPGNAPMVAATAGSGARIEVLENWLSAPTHGECNISLQSTLLAGRMIFVYAGNMGAAQGMDCLLELAEDLAGRNDAGFLFVGRGSEVERLREHAKLHDLRHVLFMDEVDSKSIPGLLAQCHVGLIALDPRHTTHNIPGKFLTYLRAGLPVLARINAGNDLEQIIETEGVGCVCVGEAEHQLESLATKLLDQPALRNEMAKKGKPLVESRYSSASAVKRIIAGIT
ncbi:glycosyltransferase family 4 protein [Rhodanobacter sp. DHG33]|uniref:glycosyltransferase family 4 protein n=1 Tax=Rhodanobacter sp. DHG33 TaxID=2775921 RepID=UPI00177D4C94|nr:glycosyltransferase family 4 protein [Rhodanobacter sp. DHG33]MBD8897424.1 glycosyltransferase family 4 protein [Rhodanobacter sp. DHG33]